MPDKTYKIIELVGVSEESIQQAIRNAVTRASESLKGLDWFEVNQIRGQITEGRIAWYQVDMRVGFRVMTPEEMNQG